MPGKKQFDRNRRHVHRCQDCKAEIPCRAIGCTYPEWTECSLCARGWRDDCVEGTPGRTKKVPAKNPSV